MEREQGGRQHSVDHEEMKDMDDAEDATLLLVRPASGAKESSMVPLEMAKSSRRRTISNRCVRTPLQLLVAPMVFVCATPLFLLFYQTSPPEFILEDSCLEYFNVSVGELMEQVSEARSFCFEDTHKCICDNPFEPRIQNKFPNSLLPRWIQTFERNQDLANQSDHEKYDVVFLGDSIIEHWVGTDLGYDHAYMQEANKVFRQYFTKSGGGQLEGLALGIGGDRCGQLLYRLQNGELPDALDAKVFWILIGTNDLGADRCSAETISAGTFRIVEEIRSRRPNAKIVLNTILPRGTPGVSVYETGRSWLEITKINHWLECYAKSMNDLEFFNATDLFLQENETIQMEEYFQDPVHPSAAGYTVWGQAIVEKVLSLT